MDTMNAQGLANRGWLVGVLCTGLFAFYALAIDQGLLFSLFQGDTAFTTNLLHEFVHDARHVAGFPCH